MLDLDFFANATFLKLFEYAARIYTQHPLPDPALSPFVETNDTLIEALLPTRLAVII